MRNRLGLFVFIRFVTWNMCAYLHLTYLSLGVFVAYLLIGTLFVAAVDALLSLMGSWSSLFRKPPNMRVSGRERPRLRCLGVQDLPPWLPSISNPTRPRPEWCVGPIESRCWVTTTLTTCLRVTRKPRRWLWHVLAGRGSVKEAERHLSVRE